MSKLFFNTNINDKETTVTEFLLGSFLTVTTKFNIGFDVVSVTSLVKWVFYFLVLMFSSTQHSFTLNLSFSLFLLLIFKK